MPIFQVVAGEIPTTLTSTILYVLTSQLEAGESTLPDVLSAVRVMAA